MVSLLKGLNQPLFTLHDLILWTIALQCLLISGMLFCRPGAVQSDRWLALFLLSVGGGEVAFFVTYNTYLSGMLLHLGPWVLLVPAVVFYLQGPFLYLYLKSLTVDGFRCTWRHGIAVPVWGGLSLSFTLFWPAPLEAVFWRPYVLVATLGLALSLGYGVAAFRLINRHSRRLEDWFCTVDIVDFRWLRILVGGFLVVWAASIVPSLTFHWVSWAVQDILSHFPRVLELIMISFGIVAGMVGSRRVQRLPDTDIALSSGSTGSESPAVLAKIDQRVREEALYALPQMNIERMAELLGLPARQLSQLINQELHKNFFEFINDYRLERVKFCLSSSDWNDASVQNIYESAGFRSRSSFFTYFKRRTGLTPVQFREKAKRSGRSVATSVLNVE